MVSTLQSYCQILFRYRPKTKNVRLLCLVKSVLFFLKKTVDSKIVVRSVFFFNIVWNNGRKIKSFKKNYGGI
jgi:hypothetical protein